MKYASLLKIVSPLLFDPCAASEYPGANRLCQYCSAHWAAPADSLPPKLMSVNPHDSARNFTGKKIVFEFNEFVQIDNIQENLLVSPVPKVNPLVDSKLRTVTVQQ